MDFADWMKTQPFGGPSRVRGKSLLADSTIQLMKKAWDASREEMRKELASLPFNPEQEIPVARMRGDIND